MYPFTKIPQKVRLPEFPRLVLTLALAGLFSGLAIVGIYRVTLPVIQENQAAALRRAVFEVLPGAQRMQRLEWTGDALVPEEATAGDPDPAVYAGYGEDGRLLGYAIPGAGAGYQDTIRLIYGYDPVARQVVGMEILESRETPGLGDKIFKDVDFVQQFRDLSVEPRVELIKEGVPAENQVDAITGATISSQTVVDIIQERNTFWLDRLPGPDEAPPLEAGPGPAEARPGPPEERGGPIPGGKLGEDAELGRGTVTADPDAPESPEVPTTDAPTPDEGSP